MTYKTATKEQLLKVLEPVTRELTDEVHNLRRDVAKLALDNTALSLEVKRYQEAEGRAQVARNRLQGHVKGAIDTWSDRWREAEVDRAAFNAKLTDVSKRVKTLERGREDHGRMMARIQTWIAKRENAGE